MRLRRPRWPTRPPGKRGEILLLLGALMLLLGASDVLIPTRVDGLLYLLIPAPVRLAVWLGSGIVAIFYAWMPRHRSDAVGFLALYLMLGIRCVSYLVAWVDYASDGRGGYAYGWLAAGIYAAFMGVIGVCASWRENPRGDVGEAAR